MEPKDIIRGVEALDRTIQQQQAEITKIRSASNAKDIKIEELNALVRGLEAKLKELKGVKE